MIRIVFVLMMAVFMTGCTPDVFRRYEVVEQKTMLMAKFDESLLEPCNESTPPAVDQYTMANRDRKEALLTTYVADLILDNKRCSLDKTTLKSMLVRQKEAIQKFNDDEELRVKTILNGKEKEKE